MAFNAARITQIVPSDVAQTQNGEPLRGSDKNAFREIRGLDLLINGSHQFWIHVRLGLHAV